MDLVLLTGNAHPELAENISAYLDIPLAKARVGSFSDGETRVELDTNVRGADVFIIQPTCAPTNQHIMEALILADTCRRASAGRMTLVAPYFGYARQERKSAPRTPITAKLVADLIAVSGFHRVLALELHTSAIQGFFNIPVDHLFAKPVFQEAIKPEADTIVISPDAGGVERARAMAKVLNCGLAIIDKRRDRPNESSVMNIIGDVQDKHCVIVDDICDTAGTLTKGADALKEAGAKSVLAAISHPVLSGSAIDRIESSSIDKLIFTDSIPLKQDARACSKIEIVSIADLMGRAIRRIHNSESVSSLFI